MDLTVQQEEENKDDVVDRVEDEFDILEAYIDPFDVKMQRKKDQIGT